MLSPWLLLLVAVYCGVQTIRDFRARNYLMAALGCLCVAAILFMPMQSRAVKFDLPASP